MAATTGVAARGLPRRAVALAGGVVAVALAGAHQGAWSGAVLALVMTAAIQPDARTRGPAIRDLLAWVPIGAAILFAAVVMVSVLAGYAGITLWSPTWAVATWVALCTAVTVGGALRGGRVRLWSPLSLIAWAPALAIGCVGSYRFTQPLAYWSRPVWERTDWVNHVQMVVDLRLMGLLDYRLPTSDSGGLPDIYPRGLHAALAWLSQVTQADPTALRLWESSLLAAMVLAVVMATLAIASACLLAVVVARRLGAPFWLRVAAPVVIGLAFVHPTLFDVLLRAGFLTTSAMVICLYALVLLSAVRRGTGGYGYRLVLATTLTMAAFHLWQLLVLPFVIADCYYAWRWWRAGRHRAVRVVAVALASVAACLPLAQVTLTAAGFGQAGTPGEFVSISPWVILTVGLLPVVALLGRSTRPRRDDGFLVVYATSIVAVLALGLVLVPVGGGTLDDAPYYAGKVLWHGVVLALPAIPAVGWLLFHLAWRSHWLASLGRGSRLASAVILGAPAVLAVAYFGGSLTYAAPDALREVVAAGGGTPQVPLAILQEPGLVERGNEPVLVWSLNPQGWHPFRRYDDLHAAQIAQSLGHPVPWRSVLVTHSLAGACAWLGQNPAAIRITGPLQGQDELLATGCPESVVRPELWRVVMTPDSWWTGTEWAAFGGRPDPDREVLVPAPAQSAGASAP